MSFRKAIGESAENHGPQLRRLAEVAHREFLLRDEDENLSSLLYPALPIAASCCLGNGVDPGSGSVDDREVNIDTGLDQLGADNSACVAGCQVCPELPDDLAAVLGTHETAEVESSLGIAEFLEELPGVSSCVYDAQGLMVSGQPLGQVIVSDSAQVFCLYPSERLIQTLRVRHDFPDAFEAILEIIPGQQGRLCVRADYDR